MTLTYGLIFITGVLTGGGFGLFGSALHRERAAAEEHEAELEVAEFQELYETLATFHQDGPAVSNRNRAVRSVWLPGCWRGG